MPSSMTLECPVLALTPWDSLISILPSQPHRSEHVFIKHPLAPLAKRRYGALAPIRRKALHRLRDDILVQKNARGYLADIT